MKNLKKALSSAALIAAFMVTGLPTLQAAPLLQLYSQGREVGILQQMLQSQGYQLSVNGHFD